MLVISNTHEYIENFELSVTSGTLVWGSLVEMERMKLVVRVRDEFVAHIA